MRERGDTEEKEHLLQRIEDLKDDLDATQAEMLAQAKQFRDERERFMQQFVLAVLMPGFDPLALSVSLVPLFHNLSSTFHLIQQGPGREAIPRPGHERLPAGRAALRRAQRHLKRERATGGAPRPAQRAVQRPRAQRHAREPDRHVP